VDALRSSLRFASGRSRPDLDGDEMLLDSIAYAGCSTFAASYRNAARSAPRWASEKRLGTE
jgi:hypothetical protein